MKKQLLLISAIAVCSILSTMENAQASSWLTSKKSKCVEIDKRAVKNLVNPKVAAVCAGRPETFVDSISAAVKQDDGSISYTASTRQPLPGGVNVNGSVTVRCDPKTGVYTADMSPQSCRAH
jgi:hypothetical protein